LSFAFEVPMGALHPLVVHFTIALAVVGVAFRLISLLGRPAFMSPAATTLLILAAVSSLVSAQSGADAHGPVESAPGARAAVVEHEEWGERARNMLLIVGVFELAALALRRSPKVRVVHALAAVAGIASVFAVFQAARHGGDLVYNYAGGVGLRNGDPKDVERLLLAGLYHQALADRQAGRPERAAELLATAAKRFPTDIEVNLLAAESMLLDHKNPLGALATLARVYVPTDDRILSIRSAALQADAFEAAGEKDEAMQTLERVLARFPNPRLSQRLDAMKGGTNAAPR
jgi:uncharacterized membrane protein